MDARRAPAAIRVLSLSKRYRAVAAVDDLSFTVPHGEVFALLGPNGAGKTTTIEILEGYRAPDTGTVEILGLDPRRDRRALKTLVGLMLQEGGLYPGIRVGEAVGLFASFYPDPAPTAEIVEAVGLTDRVRSAVRTLSGGERQRLSLALALVGRPKVLFLDEPTAGMDPHARAAAWESIRTLRAEGVTVLLTSHLIEEVERVADRVAIIDRGRLVAGGTPQQIAGGDRLDFRTDREVDASALAARLGAPAVERTGPNRYTIDLPPAPSVVAALAAFLAEQDALLVELRAGSGSLEEAYLRLTRP